MNYKKFYFAYSRNGITGLLNVLFGKIGLKFRIKSALDLRIKWIGDYVKKFTNNIVYSGLYKGMKIDERYFWSQKDISSKLLGLYETEVQNMILKSQNENKKKYLINLGGGDGYHLVGLLRSNIFEKSIVFETDEFGRKIIDKNLKINEQDHKVKILGEANQTSLINALENFNLKDCFFLIDIEGHEYDLLNNDILKKLSKSILLIELHKTNEESLKLIKSLEEIYNINKFCTEARDLSKFKFLNVLEDNDRWLSVSEHRSNMMFWLICAPKTN